jgi:beta-phosphoglucomutase-like phosphatase (HAD superfamily)
LNISTTAAAHAFIFDMDGTMIDSMPFHAKSWVVFCQNHGVALSLEELMAKTTGRTGHECMEILFNTPLSVDRALPLIAEKEGIYRDLFQKEFREVAGFKAFAAQAQAAGIICGIGTAGDKHNIAFAMGHLKMTDAPSVIVGGDEGLAGKPNPAIFLEVARRLGVAPEQCTVFEDAPFGIEAARRAGMNAVAICSSHQPDELDGAHVLEKATNFDELLASGFIQSGLYRRVL